MCYRARRRIRPFFGASFGQPLNGQRIRRQTIEALLDAFAPDAIVETGTFLGWTARYLASHGIPVYTVELRPANYHIAKRALRRYPNVTAICGDSVEALRWLDDRSRTARPFLYLDAHWEERVPLDEELELAFERWRDALVVIDDFYVPHDPAYGYDVYANRPFALERFDIPAGTAVAYPAAPAAEETGFRRGAVYLGRGRDAHAAIEDAVGANLLTANGIR